jgi:glutamate-1-semialdehyde 2,1-aminomutase
MFERAQRVMPGGNSRLTVYTAPYPIYAAYGEGCWMTDIDGHTRIDCVNNMTVLLHGHSNPAVLGAARAQMEKLMSVAAPTEAEVELAERICARIASVERVRFANSGTEAMMFAIRAARAYTSKWKIAKGEGCYNGSYDPVATGLFSVPSNWGPAHSPHTVGDGPGIPPSAIDDVVTFPYNDTVATVALIEAHAHELAAVVLDAAPGRLWYTPGDKDYVAAVREVTKRLGIVLILDEVQTFRLDYGGAQALWDLSPDLTAFGKAIGGGMPIGAVGGLAEFMQVFDHLPGRSFVVHGGTFNASAVAMAAGAAALDLLTPAENKRLNGLGVRLREGLSEALRASNIPGWVQGQGSLNYMLLGDASGPVRDHREKLSRTLDPVLSTSFYRAMLDREVFIGDGGLFVLSTAMDDAIVDRIVEASAEALATLEPVDA